MSPLASTRSMILGKVLRRVAPDLLAAVLAIEARIVAGAVQRLVRGVVTERKSLVRADRREADDVAVRPDAARNLATELEQDAGRVGVRISDLQRLVGFEVADIRKAVRRIAEPEQAAAPPPPCCGMTVAAAAPAAATPAPDKNHRRPISTLRSHLFMRSSH